MAHQVSRFLQNHLSTLKFLDLYATKHSDEVVSFLKEVMPIGYAFAVDVADLYYSIPHQDLFLAVRDCIEDHDVSFQNSCGTIVDNLMTLLEFYLQSTFVAYKEEMFVQRKGVCIGSCVAPVLCEIFLASIDRNLERDLEEGPAVKVLRYVHDFVLIFKGFTCFKLS